MNCKPGDLAIVVPPSTNAGMIVEVMRPARGEHFTGLFSWYSRSAGAPMKIILRKDGSYGFKEAACIPDAWLRPVSGLPINDEIPNGVRIPA